MFDRYDDYAACWLPFTVPLTSHQEYGQHHGEDSCAQSEHGTENGPIEDLRFEQFYRLQEISNTDKHVSNCKVENVDV